MIDVYDVQYNQETEIIVSRNQSPVYVKQPKPDLNVFSGNPLPIDERGKLKNCVFFYHGTRFIVNAFAVEGSPPETKRYRNETELIFHTVILMGGATSITIYPCSDYLKTVEIEDKSMWAKPVTMKRGKR